MKTFFLWTVLFMQLSMYSQNQHCEKLIIITIDGVRWQEVFEGADSSLLFSPKTRKDSIVDKFWSSLKEDRRKRLMPFMWNCLEQNGQILGNRKYHNKMQVKNIARVSYAGYNEIFTGNVDNHILTNKPVKNKNINVLEYLNKLGKNEDSVAVFTSWDIFPYIFNKDRNRLWMNCGYTFSNTDSSHAVANKKLHVYNTVGHQNATRKDALTYTAAKTYLAMYQPKVMYIGFGEADEFGHQKEYNNYIHNLNMVDSLINNLWEWIETNEAYKNKTTILITTDHGRGAKPKNWNKHGIFVKGSNHTWMAIMGNCIKPLGEHTKESQVYSYQIAPTIANLMGTEFSSHQESLLQTLNR
jgi:Metalloenzyme superfamily